MRTQKQMSIREPDGGKLLDNDAQEFADEDACCPDVVLESSYVEHLFIYLHWKNWPLFCQ